MAAVLLALFPTVIAWFGTELIASTGLIHYDIDVADGIGIVPLTQGLGIGYLGSAGMDIMRVLWNTEVITLAWALPVLLVGVAALLRRRWHDRTTLIVAVILGILAAINLAANIVGPWSGLTQCPPDDVTAISESYTCFRNGTGVGIPPFLYGPAYAIAAHVLTGLRYRARAATPLDTEGQRRTPATT